MKFGAVWDGAGAPRLGGQRPLEEEQPFYSIKGQFKGATVLVTGASGYIGSVVLEQLLRTTDVAAVYLLLRGRRGADPSDRVSQLLQSSLFHMVRDNRGVVSKVRAVQGDIQQPGIGLSAADRARLVRGVDVIVHCAADIRLEPTIQETLQANFEGTRAVLELAAACPNLRALVHVSSCFVNVNRPRSSVVAEQLYPLKFGEQVVDAEDVAHELMTLPPGDADMRAVVYMKRWKFPNTYTLGKHLTEHLVAKYQSRLNLPVAIVRPSLVSAIAGAPYPGYSGNWAGCIGAGAAMAIGLFDCLGSVASHPLGVWDIVPADLVGSAIIAAAAAVAAGAAPGICRATGSGALYKAPPPPGARASGAGGAGGAAAAALAFGARALAAAGGKGAFPGSVALSEGSGLSRGSSCATGSASDGSASDGSAADCSPRAAAAAAAAAACPGAGAGAGAAAGGRRLAQLLEAPGAAERAAAAARAGGERRLLVVHAATSSTYPLTLMEGWNYNLEFFAAHPPPFSITPGCLPRMRDDFVPSDAKVMACRAWTGWKVWVVCSLLKLFGREKEARKLQVGYETFCIHNNSKTDRDLTFSTRALVALEAALDPSERAHFLLVWRPVPDGSGEPARRGALAAVGGDMCWRRYCHTQMAGIYRMLFNTSTPAVAAMRHATGGGALPGDVLKAAQDAAAAISSGNAAAKRHAVGDAVSHVVAHDFARIR